MISKNEVKYIQSLSDKKNRDRDGVFIAEGPKLVTELLESGLPVKTIYATEHWQAPVAANVEVKQISLHDLQRISQFETANQVLAIIGKKDLPPLQLRNTITLALDGIQDPGNVGTIIRTADWFGIKQIVATADTADCYNSKVVQSTMGSIARVNVYYTDLSAVFATTDVPVIGALLNGKNLYEVNPLQEAVVVIGNESKGIRENIQSLIQQAVTIPRYGNAESLNAAVATGIILSHLVSK